MAGESDGDSSRSSMPEWVSFDDDDHPPVAPAAGAYGATSATSAGLLPAPPERDLGSLPFGASTADGSAYVLKMQRRLDLLKQPGNVSITTPVRPSTPTASRSQTIGANDNDDDFDPRSESRDAFTASTDAGGGVNSNKSCCCCCWPWARDSYAAADTARADALTEIDDLLPKAARTSSERDGAKIPLDPDEQPYVQLLNECQGRAGGNGRLPLSDDWIEPEPESEPR